MTTPPRTTSARPLLRFTLIAVGLYLLWFVGYTCWLEPDGRVDALLTHSIAVSSAWLLRVVGFSATVPAAVPNLVLLGGHGAVQVGPACDGFVLYALFVGFVLAFPGSALRKLWFIPAGVLIIYAINVLRIAALAVNNQYSQETVDFNHHYTFTFIVYGCIFLLWMWWATRLAKPVTAATVYA